MEALILKGSPAEIAQFLALRPELASHQAAPIDIPTLPAEVGDWLDEWAIRPPNRALFERLVAEALSWDGVRHRITKGRKGQTRFAGRIGFVKQGETEAFAFVGHGGRLVLRLDKDIDISDFPNARRRNVTRRRFGVLIYVRTEEALKEALSLLRQAYES